MVSPGCVQWISGDTVRREGRSHQERREGGAHVTEFLLVHSGLPARMLRGARRSGVQGWGYNVRAIGILIGSIATHDAR